MLITSYKSKMDKYGNTYHAVSLSDCGEVLRMGTVSGPNVRSIEGYDFAEIELPIREFEGMVKGLPYFGCRWKDIRKKLFDKR